MRARPWRRPGALRYAAGRIRNILRPPVTVEQAPAWLRKEHDVEVSMRDGIVLRVNVYLPAGPGPFPVIMSAHPSKKDALPKRTRSGWRLNPQFRVMNQPEPFRISSETGWEAPDPVRWAAAGYAVINADLRGAGTSDGVGSLLSDAEANDVHDLIEWAGTQPWSTGAVGMLGVSYLALSQYKAAALRPPHLRAICPWEGFTDVYRDFMRPGGVDEDGFSRIWAALTKRGARMTTDFARDRPAHPLRDAWWQAMTRDLARIDVPVLVCASFSDADLHSTGSMRAFEQVGSRERHVYTHRGPKWATFYSDAAFETQRAFFDRHLLDGSRTPQAPVRLEVREDRTTIAAVRTEDEWPLARTRWTPLHLALTGLLPEPPRTGGSFTLSASGPAARFDHTFAADTEVTGPMEAKLMVELRRGSDATLFVGVEKWSGDSWVPFEGSYGWGRDRIATGHQRVTLRRLDTAQSRIGQPVPTFTHEDAAPQGEVVAVHVALGNSATLFLSGETLRLIVALRNLDRRNPLFGHFPAHYRAERGAEIVVHGSAEHPSCLVVPVIPHD